VAEFKQRFQIFFPVSIFRKGLNSIGEKGLFLAISPIFS
jgi:hypothetical protein